MMTTGSLVAVLGCAGGETTGNQGRSDAEPASDVILIGEYGSLTGSEATFGQSTDNGVKLAIEEIIIARFRFDRHSMPC